MRDVAQKLERVWLWLDRIGIWIVHPADHLDRGCLHLEGLPLRRRRYDRSRRLNRATGRKLQNLIAVIRQRVRRDHLQRMERGSVRQMHEGNARLGITPCAHPSFDRGRRFHRRLPGENLAHAEHSFVHSIESYPESTNCPAIPVKRAARASPRRVKQGGYLKSTAISGVSRSMW